MTTRTVTQIARWCLQQCSATKDNTFGPETDAHRKSIDGTDRAALHRRQGAPQSLPYAVIGVTFTLMTNVKVRRRGATTISTKHQVTIPVAELRAAGLEAGERLVARADGPGRVILEREHDVLSEFAGALTGAYSDAGLDTLRDEWD
jgi:bifunctional DNA-binding transcriptional regulator/antitoxin component of YhaV-PrlF toxin-antitoxin module